MLLALNGGSKCYYDLLGPETGPVVCFSHSLAADGGMWAEQVPIIFEAGYRVLRLDMRGHGGSDAVSGDYRMEDLADDIAALIDALGIPLIHFVGLSIGGMIGQIFGLRYGSRVKSLMLCDTHAAAAPNAKELWAPRVNAVKQANSLLPIADATMERWLSDRYRRAYPGRWKQVRDTICATSPQGYLGCAAAIQNFDFKSQLSSIQVPTLVVCGSDDPGASPADNKKIAELIPNAHYEEIAGALHLPNIEYPEIFNRILIDWLGRFDK